MQRSRENSLRAANAKWNDFPAFYAFRKITAGSLARLESNQSRRQLDGMSIR